MSPACVLFKAPSAPVFTFAGVPPLVAKATTGNHDAANPQWRVTIPTTAAPGDLAIVSVSAINLGGATHTTPAGWTLLDSGTATSGFNNTARLYSKILVAGDIGVMIQFGSSTDKWSTSVRVYRNAAIDAFAKSTTNSKTGSFTQVAVTATQPRGVNVQIITGTGNQAWSSTPARSAHASHHHTALQFAVPAFSGQTSQDKIYTSTGATTTTGGIVATAGGTGMAVVQWNVLVYSTLPIILPINDTYNRADSAPPAGVGTTSDFKQSWYERGLNNVEDNPWGINANELYLATNNTTGTVTYVDAGTPDVTASILVSVIGTSDKGLLMRYDPTNDSRIEVLSNSSGAITTREVNGAGTPTVLGTTAGGTLTAGQRLGCKVSGGTLYVLINGLTVATYATTQNQATGRFHGTVANGTGTTLFRGNDYNITSP